jgi:hypothetical protein
MDSELLKEDARKCSTPKDNQGKMGKINVTNVVRRCISRENAQIGKRRNR